MSFDLFLTSVHFLLLKEAISNIGQQSCKGNKKRDWFLVSIVEFNFQISQRKKNYLSSSFFWN